MNISVQIVIAEPSTRIPAWRRVSPKYLKTLPAEGLAEVAPGAGRDGQLRERAAEFWRGNFGLIVEALEATAQARGTTPRFDLRVLATAAIALDIGLSIQRFVDPERVGLDMWPDAFDALYAGVEEPG